MSPPDSNHHIEPNEVYTRQEDHAVQRQVTGSKATPLKSIPGALVGILHESSSDSNTIIARAGAELHVEQEAGLRRILHGEGEPVKGFDREGALKGCGKICDLSVQGVAHGKYFSLVRKPVDCMALYNNTISDAPAADWPPPEKIPEALLMDYTMNSSIFMDTWYWRQRYSGGNAQTSEWTTDLISQTVAEARSATLLGTYGKRKTHEIRDLLQRRRANIEGKHFFVIGSENPWLEALLLDAGAAHITTIEYGKIHSSDSRISAMTPDDVRTEFLRSNGTSPRFDGGATFSSIEHSGLGRYGDSLNPWGDLQAMGKAWCITKSGGPMFVGIPAGHRDFLHWNAHRVYGPIRYPQLMANFLQLDSDVGDVFGPGEEQTMVAFERQDSPE